MAKFSPKLAQKVAKAVFTLNMTLLEIAQKVSKYLGYFCNQFDTKNFQKSPNQVTFFRSEYVDFKEFFRREFNWDGFNKNSPRGLSEKF